MKTTQLFSNTAKTDWFQWSSTLLTGLTKATLSGTYADTQGSNMKSRTSSMPSDMESGLRSSSQTSSAKSLYLQTIKSESCISHHRVKVLVQSLLIQIHKMRVNQADRSLLKSRILDEWSFKGLTHLDKQSRLTLTQRSTVSIHSLYFSKQDSPEISPCTTIGTSPEPTSGTLSQTTVFGTVQIPLCSLKPKSSKLEVKQLKLL